MIPHRPRGKMKPRSAVASGLLTLAMLGGCSSPNHQQRPEQPAPPAPKTASAPLTAPAPAPAPSHPLTENRLVNSGLIIESFAAKFGAPELKQIPSEVIDTGVFRYVPYLSYEASQLELNIYGDPQHPAGVEIGVYAGKDSTKEEIRKLIAGLLQKAEDRELVHGLALEKDELQRAGLTFVVTPATAEDAFGGWWISIYDANAIEKARASDAELKVLAQKPPKSESTPTAPAGKKKGKKHARKPGEAPRVYIKDYSREGDTYVPADSDEHW
ncbi:hypothetical protein JRI60_45145 [Archangium violaceum]|uniref:hypothetical protein n=1 Tax=Archangium violaceum TaxID=83451 RepID=UPI0019503631|nr:hypothetical protein [Archangium violaceum]QRN96139.1 hypothetical protein JRI60_45145 [Archangium violaceum]